MIFVTAFHLTGLETRSKARKPIKLGIKGRGRSGTSRDSNPASHWPTRCHVDLCYLSYVPPTHEWGTRPFLRWIRLQGQSPHASGKAKNTFGPIGILLIRAPQEPGNKPNPTEGGKSLGDGPLKPEELSSAEAHPAGLPKGTTAYRMWPNNWRGKIIHDL